MTHKNKFYNRPTSKSYNKSHSLIEKFLKAKGIGKDHKEDNNDIVIICLWFSNNWYNLYITISLWCAFVVFMKGRLEGNNENYAEIQNKYYFEQKYFII